MIAKVGRNLSKYLKLNNQKSMRLQYRQKIALAHPNVYYFSQTSRNKILKELQEQMQYYRQNLAYKDSQNLDYFKKQGWEMIYGQPNTLYSFSKSSSTFEIKVFTHVKSNPPNLQKEEQEPGQNPKQKKFNYAQLIIWIQKKQQSRWMVSQLGVVEGGVQLTTVHFTEMSPGIGWEKHVYAGPDITSLPKQILQSINSIFQRAGLQTQLLMNMVIYASKKSDQLDYTWMSNFKQILS